MLMKTDHQGQACLLSLFFSCREFGRWKVNNLAVERRDFLNSALPLTPEFIRNIRLLGRRPTAQLITDNLIKKYGTHFLLSATLGGRKTYSCETSLWWFCTKVIIPTVNELKTNQCFSCRRNTDRSHAYLHLNFNSIKPSKITCDMLCRIMYYFFHCVVGRGRQV